MWRTAWDGRSGLPSIAVRRFVPLVEQLVPHQDAHLVAEVEQLGLGRVVAGPEGVDAHVFEDLELPLPSAEVEGGAQGPEVVVEVDALELHAPAVQVEAVVGQELEGADAEARFPTVDDAPVDAERGDGRVEVGCGDVPAAGVRDGELVPGAVARGGVRPPPPGSTGRTRSRRGRAARHRPRRWSTARGSCRADWQQPPGPVRRLPRVS